MKKITGLIIILFVIATYIANGQSRKEAKKNRIKSTSAWQTDNADASAKPYKEYYEEFDSKGNSLLKIDYKKGGGIVQKIVCSYNNDNKRTEELEYDSAGNLVKKTTFSYNANGEKTAEIITDRKGQVVKKMIFKYNEKGLKTEKKTLKGSGEQESLRKYVYEYYK